MLKSLFSGVSGLQSHQVAMDVEANNIANVNTVGFKYSRANFSDLLSQTRAIATAPQGQLGGKNPVQVGLGSTVNSTTRIFSQGSVQNTDKNTDLAIEGDGFFIVSPDGGRTYKYTRAGDFKFDANGNFVDNNGFIVQGWLRDATTGKVDSTAPITNINIPPGLTTPARATAEVVLKAKLNSGPNIEHSSVAYSVPSGLPPAIPIPHAIDENGLPVKSGDMGVMFNASNEALSLQNGQGVWIAFQNSTHLGGAVTGGTAAELELEFTLDDGSSITVVTTGASNLFSQAENGVRYVSAINAQSSITGVTATYDALTSSISLINLNDSSSESHNIRINEISAVAGLGTTAATAGLDRTAYKYTYDSFGSSAIPQVDNTFTTLADLRYAMEVQLQDYDLGAGDGTGTVIINDQGKIEIKNGGTIDDYDLSIYVTSINTPGNTENIRFTANMEALNASLAAGSAGTVTSQTFNVATSSSSIDIYDSLGSKHTLRIEFRKVAVVAATGTTWDMVLTVPPPATIDTVFPFNEKIGSVKFNNDGSLATYNPPNLSFTANNGSSPNQQVNLSFGTANSFDGMTSFDGESTTTNISQDGFTGGDLIGIRIDQSGTLVGSFSNGRSFALAQISMAKFANNEGLSVEGGNIFNQTANSGDPIVGTAATGGRGAIRASSLEASNVDLSRALTQLIIIQRGYQANGKIITTSDQLLETLIGLKR